jgi:hypothetical protein
VTAEKNAWHLEGAIGQQLDEVTEAEARRSNAQEEADRWAFERDELIRLLLGIKVPVHAIVSASGLSRGRVYQIRDRRR